MITSLNYNYSRKKKNVIPYNMNTCFYYTPKNNIIQIIMPLFCYFTEEVRAGADPRRGAKGL